jgi:hypothetical protein
VLTNLRLAAGSHINRQLQGRRHSIDQIAAARLGNETELASLELGLESTDLAGACDVGVSCAYVNTLSWRSPTTPPTT